MDRNSTNWITLVWLVLVSATGLSWWLGADHGLDGREAASIGILVLAMIKVRLVILYFMEVRTAPLPLRLICEAWVVALCGVMVGLYLLR